MLLLILLAWSGNYKSSGSANIHKCRNYGTGYIISISDSIHEVYGLSYPATYQIDIPVGESGLHAYYSYDNSSWNKLTERDTLDWFNGVKAVRWDYLNNKAYISVPFDTLNHIYIKITRGTRATSLKNISYDSITLYYDNRQSIVTITADDWSYEQANLDSFMKACDIFQLESLWASIGIITFLDSIYTNWDSIQKQLDEGFIEAGCHGKNNDFVPYADYDWMIGDSKQDIIDNLNIPLPNRKGNDEYVPLWIAPGGGQDATSDSLMGYYMYLIDRIVQQRGYYFFNWQDNHYYRAGAEYNLDDCNNAGERDDADSIFAFHYTNGNIYHLRCHPKSCNWSAGSFERQHLDSIAGHKDIWYVGFGHLYQYHYLQERDKITTSTFKIWHR